MKRKAGIWLSLGLLMLLAAGPVLAGDSPPPTPVHPTGTPVPPTATRVPPTATPAVWPTPVDPLPEPPGTNPVELLPPEARSVYLGGVEVIPFVIVVVEFIKRMVNNGLRRRAARLGQAFAPVPGDYWLMSATGLALVLFVLAMLDAGVRPVGALEVVALLVQGVTYGLAAAKLYDLVLDRPAGAGGAA